MSGSENGQHYTSPHRSPIEEANRVSAARMVLDQSARPRRSGLELPPRLPFETWQRIGRQISLISDCSRWWLGDWLIYGERHYPNRYRMAIEATSLDYQTLKNYAWIARRIPRSRRRDQLSLQHHAEVAALPPSEQEHWLRQAAELGWTRRELRKRLREIRNGGVDKKPDEATVRIDVLAERQRRWQEAAEAMELSLAEWIVVILDQAAVEVAGDVAKNEEEA